MQNVCPFLWLNDTGLAGDELAGLERRQQNMFYITIDNFEAEPQWRRAVTVPYSTRLHFTPPSAATSSLHGTLMPIMTPTSTEAWRPGGAHTHTRPLLASYITMRSNAQQGPLWQTKLKVRPVPFTMRAEVWMGLTCAAAAYQSPQRTKQYLLHTATEMPEASCKQHLACQLTTAPPQCAAAAASGVAWSVQVHAASLASDEIFLFNLKHRNRGAHNLSLMPGVLDAAQLLGFPNARHFRAAVVHHMELVPLLSEFCLTPSGDTPTRRGFVESFLLGCVPVVFHNLSRSSYPWHLKDEAMTAGTVLLDEDALGGYDLPLLVPTLRALRPQLPEMRAALARSAMQLQWAYADLSEAEHAVYGPDALDATLVGMQQRR